MCNDFKNPGADDSDESDELADGLPDEVNEYGIPVVIAADENESDMEPDGDIEPDISSDDSFDPFDDDSMYDDSDEPENSNAEETGGGHKKKAKHTADEGNEAGPSGSGLSARNAGNGNAGRTANAAAADDDDDDDDDDILAGFDLEGEDDETIRAIIAAIKKPRTAPPEIKLDDFITDISFHPDRDIVALATITGDVLLYQYANEGNTLLHTIEVHAKACRDVEFSTDGALLLSCSKDKSIMITDMETEKLKKFYESAHEQAINRLHVLDENLFATGDDDGTVKMWDLRTKDSVFGVKLVEDQITQILTNDAKKLLLATSGDGYLSTINIGARKLYVQSEPYEEELNCMGLFRNDSKLVVGTSKGRLYTYNWGQFGFHCDMFPGLKGPIDNMIPITDRIACVAGEEGIIRACHIAPFRCLGVVGQHAMPIEHMDISCSGELIASSSHNNDLRFWNVKYFEDFGDIKYNEKHQTYREKRHNLPSSKFTNASDFFADLAAKPEEGEENN